VRLSRFHRGYRIVPVQLGRTWYTIVHDRTGTIIEKDILSYTRSEARGEVEWTAEKHLAFHPLPRTPEVSGLLPVSANT